MIVLEKLGTSRMTKSAKGNAEEHGRNVKAKAGLNRGILDQGWAMFASMLEYKQAWKGGMVQYIAPAYTSQKCSVCGFTDKRNRKTQAVFECVCCGHTANADRNAALNILAAGHAVLACGVDALATTVKQEPLAVHA